MLRRLLIGRVVLVLGAIVLAATFTTHWWWVAAGTVLMAAGFGFVVLGLRARAAQEEHGTG